MSRYLPYSPDQGALVPLHVGEVLGSDHLCFFVHRVAERLDLSRYLAAYGAEGGLLYHPSLMLKVWMYAYALGVTSSRRLERCMREDLAFRYLAGGAEPDFWTLNAFRRRHGRAINDSFTRVLELARGLGLCQLGTVGHRRDTDQGVGLAGQGGETALREGAGDATGAGRAAGGAVEGSAVAADVRRRRPERERRQPGGRAAGCGSADDGGA